MGKTLLYNYTKRIDIWQLHSLPKLQKRWCYFALLSLTHLVCCSLVVMVTFDHLHNIHDHQYLTHQVCYIYNAKWHSFFNSEFTVVLARL